MKFRIVVTSSGDMELKSGNTSRFKAFSNDLVLKLRGRFMGDFYYYILYLTNTLYFYMSQMLHNNQYFL